MVRDDKPLPEEALERARAMIRARDFFKADVLLRQLVRRHPDWAAARRLWGECLLILGNYAAGFGEYECRKAELGYRRAAPNEWGGGDPAGRILYVSVEQGRGDVLQHVRFLPLLADRGATVLFGCYPDMVDLMRHLDPRVLVDDWSKAPEVHNGHIWLMSLAHLLGIGSPADLPSAPYLTCPPDIAGEWAKRMAGPGLKVGLCWAGNRDQVREPKRRMPMKLLAPLLEQPGLRFFGLHVGYAEHEVQDVPAGADFTPLADELRDSPRGWAATAGVVANCDLVVSTDTAILHLAGALGKPCIAMMPYAPEWGTGPGTGERTPWYPSVLLVRQDCDDGRDGVVARTIEALSCFRHTGTLQ